MEYRTQGGQRELNSYASVKTAGLNQRAIHPAVVLGLSEAWISEGIENKQRLQTLSIDNAWSNKNFLCYLTFRMLQRTSSEVNGYNCYKHLKNTKIKRGTGNKIKTMTKLILPIVDTTSRN